MQPPTVSDSPLSDTDREILDLLRDGRVTPAYVKNKLGLSRPYANDRLVRLTEIDWDGEVVRIAPGLYELETDPDQIDTNET